MQIWVDADACPKVIKEVLYRAANRTQTQLILVANQVLQIPPSTYIRKCLVGAGFDVADNKIVQDVEPGDLVITADIPLAAAVVEKNAIALNPRGQLYSAKNINERLAIRNLSEGLRSSGLISGGPDKFSKQEVQAFSNALDRILTSQVKK